MSNSPHSALLEELFNASIQDGEDGTERVWTKIAEELSAEDQHMLAIAASELLADHPGPRAAMLNPLGLALEALAETEHPEILLRGLHVAARIQMAEQIFEDAKGVLDALEEYARYVGSPRYLFIARILLAELLIPSDGPFKAREVLEQITTDLAQHANFEQKDVLKSYGDTLLISCLVSTGFFQEANKKLIAYTGSDTALISFHRGVVEAALGNRDAAVTALNQTLSLSQHVDDAIWAFEALLVLVREQPDQAIHHLSTAQSILDQVPLESGVTRLQLVKASHSLESGSFSDAKQIVDQLEDSTDPSVLLVRAEVYIQTGPSEKASLSVGALLNIANEERYPGLAARAHLLASNIADKLENKARHIRTAEQLYERLGDPVGQARALATKSLLQVDLGDFSEALGSALKSSDIAQRHNAPDVQCLSWLGMGLASAGLRHEKETEHSLNRALKIAEDHKLHVLQIRALQALGRDEEASALARDCGLIPEGSA
jgi:tetratricopeptide (TPR) repeat protein